MEKRGVVLCSPVLEEEKMDILINGRVIENRLYLDAADLMLWLSSTEGNSLNKKDAIARINSYVEEAHNTGKLNAH